MPALGQGSGKSAAGERRSQRRRRRSSRPIAGPPTPAGLRSGAFSPPTRAFEPQQRQARAKTRRARARLPQIPVPHIPVIRNPTPRQQEAARKAITGTINRAVGRGGSGAQRQARRQQVIEDLAGTRQGQEFLRAGEHYARAIERRSASLVGKSLGVPAGGGNRIRVGRGELAYRQARDRVRPGVRKGAAARGFATILAQTSLGAASAENEFVKRSVRDIGNLGASPFIAGYEIGAGGVEALQGRGAGRLERLGKGAAQGFYNTYRHPIRSFEEAPVSTLFAFLGTAGAAGRTTGALARGVGSQAARGGLRGGLARAGSTVRPPLAESFDSPIFERTGSKDLTRRVPQRIADAMREPVRDAEGSVRTVQQRGREVPVLKASNREIEGGLIRNRAGLYGERANFLAGRGNAAERLGREQDAAATHVQSRPGAAAGRAFDKAKRAVLRDADTFVRRKGIKGRHARDAVLWVASGTIRSAKTFEQDLTKYRDDIAVSLRHAEENPKAGVYLHKGEREEAQRNLKLADTLLERTRNNPELVKRIVATGEDLGRHLNAREKELLDAGVLSDPVRAERARFIHPAVTHQDARHFHEDELAAIEREGVQVRHPEQEKAWRQASTSAQSAVRARREAEAQVRRAEQARARLVGAQASRRGRRQREGGGTATRAERGKLAKADAALAAAKGDLRAKSKAAREAKSLLSKTRRPPLRAALRHPDGRFLSTAEIRAKIAESGRDPDTVAYVPNASVGGRAFHARLDTQRPVMDKPGTRTGSQYRKGATETSVEILKEHGVHQGTQLNKARQVDHLVEQGAKHPEGRNFTWAEAEELAKRAEVDTRTGIPIVRMRDGRRMVPMRRYAASLSDEARKIVEGQQQGPMAMEVLQAHLLNDRFLFESAPEFKGGRRRTGAAENVVLVPAKMVEQLERHTRRSGEIEKFAQLLNKPFRMAVLPQPRWLTGNFVEPYVVRLTINGSGLNVFGLANDWRAAGKALRAMERSGDPAVVRAAHEIRAHQFGGLFVGGRGGTVRRGLEDFPKLEAAYGRMVSRLPLLHETTQLGRAVLKGARVPLDVFFRVNRVIESGAQRAAFGHQFRKDLQEFTGSWMETVRLQEKAVAEAAKGLVNTETQQRFMREQHKLLGQYEGFGPTLRAWVQGPTPFLPWALNAARFVYWTMPAEHTVLTSVLLQVNDVVAKDWKEIHQPVAGLKGNLQYAVPNGKGGWVDLARYTPWGLTTPVLGGEPGGLLGQFAPQAQGATKAFGGNDPFGRELKYDPAKNADPAGSGLQHAGQAGYSLAEAMVPYLSTVRRLREGGGTPYAGSRAWDVSVKPGTSNMSAARRTFDPFRPTYLGGGPQPQLPASPAAAAGSSAQSRIDAALDRIQYEDAQSAARDERINRALDAIGIP